MVKGSQAEGGGELKTGVEGFHVPVFLVTK
jgi:hypothetical protein